MNVGVLAGIGPGPAPDTTASAGAVPDSSQNALLVAGNRKEQAFSLTTGLTTPAVDCSDYRFVSVQCVTNSGGSVTFQGSNDGVNWQSVLLNRADTSGVTPVTSTSATLIYSGPVPFRYFRLSSTATASGVIEFFSVPPPSASQLVYVGNNVNVAASTATGAAIPANAFMIGLRNIANGNLDAANGVSGAADAAAGSGMLGVGPSAYTGAGWDRVRTPAIFKTATATASGDTALWTPTSGKKFRLMRYQMQITADAATSGGADIDIVLRDSTTALAAAYSVFVPATAGTTFNNGTRTEWVDLGNGILSAAANNVLNINLSAALTSGKVRVVVAGTEE